MSISDPSISSDPASKVAFNYVVHLPERDRQLFWQNPTEQSAYFDRLNSFVEALTNKGATVNVQTDYNALNNGWADSLKALQDMGASIDVHTHKDEQYNNADVAKMLQDYGFKDNGIVGGYLDTQQPLVTETANQSDYTWNPQIIWGNGTLNHKADTSATGLRKEGDLTHIASQSGGPETIDQIMSLINQNPTNNLYTNTIFAGEYLNPEQTKNLLSLIDILNSKAGSSGYWATLSQMVDDWNNNYGSYSSFTSLGGK